MARPNADSNLLEHKAGLFPKHEGEVWMGQRPISPQARRQAGAPDLEDAGDGGEQALEDEGGRLGEGDLANEVEIGPQYVLKGFFSRGSWAG